MFNISAGAVRYFNYRDTSEDLFGIAANVGWEPDNHIPLKPFVTFRSDIVFDNRVEFLSSITAGLTWSFKFLSNPTDLLQY